MSAITVPIGSPPKKYPVTFLKSNLVEEIASQSWLELARKLFEIEKLGRRTVNHYKKFAQEFNATYKHQLSVKNYSDLIDATLFFGRWQSKLDSFNVMDSKLAVTEIYRFNQKYNDLKYIYLFTENDIAMSLANTLGDHCRITINRAPTMIKPIDDVICKITDSLQGEECTSIIFVGRYKNNPVFMVV